MKIDKLMRCIKHPLGAFIEHTNYEWYKLLPDKWYLSMVFAYRFGKKLDLKNPVFYNEKLQWLKLYNRKPEYTEMVDKYAVRDYIAEKIGEEYLIPLIGVWEKAEDIDFNELPNQFVLKCTHNSGKGMCICKDKSQIDYQKVRTELAEGLKEEYFYRGREWPYKNVHKRIIAEKFMVDESGVELKDYKVMCFNGEPKLIEFIRGRFTGNATIDYYDTDWNKTQITQGKLDGFGYSTENAPKPECLEEMLRLSGVLAKEMPHVRVDWYVINGRLYFGEITFFDGSGFDPYDKLSDDELLGSWIQLPDVTE